MDQERRPRGRPPKFKEAGWPVTTTLPESALQQLAAIDDDRALAIVKAAAVATRVDSGKATSVEVVAALPGYAIIVVGPSASLRSLPWLHLVEVAPTRYLLVLPSGTAVEALEVALDDLRERLTPPAGYEWELLTELHRVLRLRRRQQDVSKAEILLLRIGEKPPAKST